MKLFLAAALIALGGCMSMPDKIVAVPQFAPDVAAQASVTYPPLVRDLKAATENLDHAVAIGALPADDPAPKCFHDVLQRAGIELPPGAKEPASFVPKRDGIVSDATIAYIIARQQSTATTRPVATSCKELIGQFVVDAAIALKRANPLGLLR